MLPLANARAHIFKQDAIRVENRLRVGEHRFDLCRASDRVRSARRFVAALVRRRADWSPLTQMSRQRLLKRYRQEKNNKQTTSQNTKNNNHKYL